MKEKSVRIRFILCIVGVLICGGCYLFLRADFQENKGVTVEESFSESSSLTEKATSSPSKESIYVHICGEVKRPGVYIFSKEPRVIEVVKRAGGFTKYAAQARLNQAVVVTDGTQLLIEKKGKKVSSGLGSTTSVKGKVNLNHATKEELMTLSGVGEAKAAMIISYREEKGSFKKIQDIMNISGIKSGVFNQIKDLISV